MVKLLLEKAYHIRPQYVGDDRAGEAEARLVIGDEALRLGPRFPHSLDLGKAWYTLTGLPFVFAVWAVRTEVWASAAAEVRAVHHALQMAKAYTRAHPESMLALAQERVALPADACRRYLRERLCFDLGSRHLEGMQTFLTMLTEAGALPTAPSLRFISDLTSLGNGAWLTWISVSCTCRTSTSWRTAERRQHGVDTADILRQAIPMINGLRPDFVVAGGDLISDESEESYRRLQALLAPLTAPIHLQMGNHDSRAAVRRVFHPGSPPRTTRSARPSSARACGSSWLDSTLPGKEEG